MVTTPSSVFCRQDRTGTAAQLTLAAPTNDPIEVGDTGVYTGLDWQGRSKSLDFTVGQVLDATDIGITTMTPSGGPGTVMQSGWPHEGTITWLIGANASSSPDSTDVVGMQPANAYASVEFFMQYHNSRGNLFPSSPEDAIQQAIVQATDYLDQRYRFKGVKLLQFLTGNPAFDPSIGFLDPWLATFGFAGSYAGTMPGFAPSFTAQRTEWPRQGVVDYNGDSVYGVPQIVQWAACEAAIRALNGVKLQPDYDKSIVAAGGVVSSISKGIGPIHKTISYDTKLGLGFFPEIPQVRRMLSSAGLLLAGGGRTVIR